MSTFIVFGYSSTSHHAQGETASEVYVGIDRHSVNWVSQKQLFVAASRGKINIGVFVENKAQLAQISLRKGDRKSAIEGCNRQSLPVDIQNKIEKIESKPKPPSKNLAQYVIDMQRRMGIKKRIAIKAKVSAVVPNREYIPAYRQDLDQYLKNTRGHRITV